MRVVVSWLRELCPTDLPAGEIAERLTVAGAHVEEVIRPWDGLSGVIAARVLEKRAHPESDRLTLALLDTGAGQAHVAAGVANWEVGDLVPYAPPGARVPALAEPLGVKTLRGEKSEGMMCSPHELGISEDHAGILVLPPGTAPGADVAALFGLEDAVLEIEIEPNRPDLMSVLGVGRELSAVTGVPVTLPEYVLASESLESAAQAATVDVVDPERCPRYLARIIAGVTVGPSPAPVQARLFASGMRPISNVVDATNYVLLEEGQPLHPFDLERLHGRGIVVRPASAGERMVTLDGVDRELSEEDLLIADRERGVAIAGVMGSAAAEVSEETKEVLLESAYFEPRGVIRTSRRLKLSTEASERFGRGSDPEMPGPAASRAAGLISKWAGGRILAGAVDVGAAPERRRLSVRPSRVSFLLAQPVAASEVLEVFRRLTVAASQSAPDQVEVEVPSYRVDLDREVDLVEEVARIRGYALLPSTVPGIRRAGGLAPSYAFRRRLRQSMVRAGLRETTSLSFSSPDDLALVGDREEDAVPVANPVDAGRGFLRTSLIPGLVRALSLNVDRQRGGAALFEIGKVFRRENEVREFERAAAAMTGPASVGFPESRRDFDFFDAKGSLESLMSVLGVHAWALGEPCGWPFHPGRSAVVKIGGEAAGAVGELHPRAAASAGLPGAAAFLDLDAQTLSRNSSTEASAAGVPRFPPAKRDLAFIVPARTQSAVVASVIKEAAGDLANRVALFDVFEGAPLPAGTKSLAFSVEFRAPDRTLTDPEIDTAVAGIAKLVARVGGELRTG